MDLGATGPGLVWVVEPNKIADQRLEPSNEQVGSLTDINKTSTYRPAILCPMKSATAKHTDEESDSTFSFLDNCPGKTWAVWQAIQKNSLLSAVLVKLQLSKGIYIFTVLLQKLT